VCLIIANKGFEARRKQMSQWYNQDERSGARQEKGKNNQHSKSS
jgi:hypothetical protein